MSKFFSGSIKSLDEALFNSNDTAMDNYTGTTNILRLPVFCGILLGLYFFICQFRGIPQSNIVEHIKLFSLPVWLLNEIFLMWRVFVLPGFCRKFFYPFFVAVITIMTFALVAYAAYVFMWLTLGIAICCALIGGAFGSEKKKLTDGTTITYSGGTWRDSSGNSYTDNGDGTFTRN